MRRVQSGWEELGAAVKAKLVLAVLVVAVLWGVGPTLEAATGPQPEEIAGSRAAAEAWVAGRRGIERSAVRTLAAGGDATEQLRALGSEPRRGGRNLLPDTGSDARDLVAALERLGAALGAEARRGDTPEASPLGDATELQAAWESFLAADLLVREAFSVTRERLVAAGIGSPALDRLAAAERQYEATVGAVRRSLSGGPRESTASGGERAGRADAVPGGQGPAVAHGSSETPDGGSVASSLPSTVSPELLRDAAARVGDLLSREDAPVLGVGDLPFRRPEMAARSPRTEPAVRPVYLDASDPLPSAADRTGSPTAPLSETMVQQAAALGHDAVRIYEFVRNGIATEWYAGAVKGAEGTRVAGAGNPVDQAALLVALLRASSIPARFVHGVVELPVGAVADDLGIGPTGVPRALARAGVPHRPVIRGGRVAAVEVEHTWVAARVPYGNYRGALVDRSAPAWVPLAPALKEHLHAPVGEALAGAGVTSDGALARFLGTPRDETPLAWIQRRVESWLAEEDPDGTYEELLAEGSVTPLVLDLLPSTLPARVVAVTGEEATLGPQHVQRLRFVVRAAAEDGGGVLLDHTLAVHQVTGRRLTLSYTPATVDDDRVVNLHGGLDATPAYLVRLRPRLKLDGRLLAVGEGDGAVGAVQRLEVTATGPWGEERLDRDLVSGAYHALAVGTAGAPVPVEEDLAVDGEGLAARLLSTVGHRFGRLWERAEEELGGLLGVAVVRPVPSLAVVTDAVEVEEVGGLPLDLAWRGVTLDAVLRAAEPLARAGGTGEAHREREWMRLAALQGSALEHAVFADELLVEAVSADRGLALARQAGIAVVTLDAGNLDAELATLDHPPEVLDDVRRRVRLGFEVEIPRSRITVADWRGSVWRAEDPATGSAGYLISGRLAGGATAEAPASWVLEFLAQALAAPYSAEPNTDPLAGAVVTKVVETDRQQGTVGRRLGQDLAVRVADAVGRPVQGATVIFRVWSGGGWLLDAEGVKRSSVEVTTGRLGLATAPFVLGTDTSLDPLYLQGAEDPVHPTRVGVNLVEAVAVSSAGDLVPDGPFEALGRPGPPHTLRRSDEGGTEVQSTHVATWADTLRVVVEDRYGNPVSNQGVRFTTKVGATDTTCTNQPHTPVAGAAVFALDECPVDLPGLGDCGGPELLRYTSTFGAAAGVILGDSAVTAYRVRVTHPELEPLTVHYGPLYVQAPSGRCDPYNPSGVPITVRTWQDVSGDGRVINAARVGRPFGRLLEVGLFYWLPEVDSVPASDGTYVVRTLPQGRWVPTRADRVELPVSNGGSATPASLDEDDLTYGSAVTVGPTPGINAVSVVAEGIDVRVPEYDPVTLEVIDPGEIEWPRLESPVSEIWGLSPRITGAVPDPIPLTDQGRTALEVTLTYEVDPPSYQAARAVVLHYADGRYRATSVGSSRSGTGTITTQRGFPFDPSERHTAQLVLNRGSTSEVRSPSFELPFAQRLFRDVPRSAVVSQEVDLVNRRVCARPDLLTFGLNRDARVSLVLRGVQRSSDGGFSPDGSEVVLLDDEALAAGDHSEPVSPTELPPGEYQLVLTGVAADGTTEVRRGFVRSLYRERDHLPVGHVLVEGVDLLDGHFTLSRQDLEVPGRGIPLTFSRTWSSPAAGEVGPLGAGWTHNWDSSVVVTECGEAIVLGGDGSGARFVDDGEGGLRPLRGHHGSLVADASGLAFDYYSRSGNRYHYAPAAGGGWDLAFVEDPSGNRTRLTYEPSAAEPGEARLAAVTDPSGRSLRFRYRVVDTVRGPEEVVSSVEGPAGLRLDLSYDDWGHLVRAEREPHADGAPSRAESYAYELRPEHAYDDRHVLAAVRDEVSGAETTYTWRRGAVGVQGEVVVPRAFVDTVTRPEGGTFAFAYQPEALRSGEAPEVSVAVTDPRGEVTRYTLNRYGAPLEVVDPLGGTTRVEWAADDALMTARTDANGVRTELTYDEHGNLLTESVEVTDFDGIAHTYTASSTYHPPSAFDPPYLKNRVATRTDRAGATIAFTYDDRGRRLREEIEVTVPGGGAPQTVATERTWFPNGDQASETDPRGHTTSFTYDAHGNPATRTDPLGGVTTSTWDARSRLVSRTDPLGRETRYGYDTLDRRVAATLPRVEGESADPIEEVRYDDAGRTRTTVDALGRSTVERFDLEGRVVERTDPAGARRVLAYDAAGNKVLESTWHDADTPRHDVTFAYDGAGRRVRRTEPAGRVTEYAYDPAGNLLRETLRDATDPGFAPRVTEHVYDELDRRIETRRLTGGGAAVTAVRYDGEGRPVETVDPLGRSTRRTFDELGRETERSEPPWRPGERRLTHFAYDGNGNLVEERLENEPEPRVRTFAYDALDRRVRSTDGTGGTTHLEYDAVGNLVRRIDPRLDVVSYRYDARDRRTAESVHLDRVSTPPRRATTTYTYDAVGNRVGEEWPNGNRVIHTYDAVDRVLESRDALGLLTRYEYDARGNRTAEVDGEGHRTEIAYDALDRPVEETAPLDRTTRWTWDVAGNRLAETDPRGHTTETAYDLLDRPVEETDPLGHAATSTYDLAGNLLARTDRRGFTTRHEYDGLDRRVRTVDPPPLASEQTFAHEAAGRRIRHADRRGIVTATTYDAEGRPLELRRDGVLLERREHDAAGNLRFLTDANGHTTGYEYDERGLRLAENRPLGAVTRWTYSDMGDVVSERDPEGRVTTRTYDLRRRLVSETDGSGGTTTWTYDLNGNRLSERRPEGNAWRYRYDAADRLVAVTDPLGAETTYTYDAADNRLSHTDANGRTTRHEYDALDRRTARVHPGGAREELSYDAAGNLVRRLDPLGQETSYAYDPLGRETLRSYGPPATPIGDELIAIATERDANGNPLRVTESYSGSTGTRVTERTYDAFDRVVSVTDAKGEALRYTYDANGNRLTVTDPDGVITRYAYDGLNRVTAVTAPAGITEYAWLRDGRLSEVSYPNGSRATHTYDAAGRTARVENTLGGALVSRFVYTHDANGNRLSQEETRGSGGPEVTTYSYDEADRLLEVSYPEQTVTYGYDAVGNRLTETAVDAEGTLVLNRTHSYDERNRLLALTDALVPDGGATFTYDAAGNRRTKTAGDGTLTTYVYDTRNRLVEVRRGDSLLETYRYDHRGLRIRRAGPEGVVHSVYDDTALLVETDPAGHTLRKYEYGPDRLLSLAESTGERRFYLFDALGSVTDLVSPAGSVEARYVYGAWGNLRRAPGSSENPFAFTGHHLDRTTGLYYAQQRYYDPELGLFLTEDPALGRPTEPPSLHRYLYAYQNPTVYVDPDGRESEVLERTGPRVIDDPSEAPAGWTVRWAGEGTYLALPPDSDAASEPEPEPEERGLFGKLVDLLVGDTREESEVLVEEGEELSRVFDEGVRKERNLDVEAMSEEELQEAYEESRGFGAVGEVTRQAGDVAAQAGKTALEAEEDASKFAILGWLKGLGKKAFWRFFGREAAEEAAERGVLRTVPKVHMGKQGKHIPGHNNFEIGKSVLRADPESLATRSGTGEQVGRIPIGQAGSKERVVFDEIIGDYVDPRGVTAPTRVGIIHYSKDGVHIVPARPQ